MLSKFWIFVLCIVFLASIIASMGFLKLQLMGNSGTAFSLTRIFEINQPGETTKIFIRGKWHGLMWQHTKNGPLPAGVKMTNHYDMPKMYLVGGVTVNRFVAVPDNGIGLTFESKTVDVRFWLIQTISVIGAIIPFLFPTFRYHVRQLIERVRGVRRGFDIKVL